MGHYSKAMRLIYIIYFSCLHSVYFCESQNIIKSAPDYLFNSKANITWCGKIAKENVFSLSKNESENKKVYVQTYSDEMQVLQSFKLKPKSRKSRIIHTLAFDNHVLLLTKKHDIFKAKNTVYIEKFAYNGKPLGNPAKIAETPLKSYKDDGEFIIDQSPDKSKTLLFNTDYNASGEFSMNITVFDGDGNLLYDTSLVPGYTNDNVDIEEIQMDNGGNFYMLSTEYLDSVYHKIPSKYKHSIHYYNAKDRTMSRLIIPSENYYIKQATFLVDPKHHKIIIQGFEGSEESDKIDGMFHCEFNLETPALVQTKNHNFNDSDRIKFLGNRVYYFSSDLKDYYIKNFYPFENGKTLLVAEKYYTSQQSTNYFVNGTMQTTYRTIFIYNEIILICLDSAGNLCWKEAIHKNQSTLNDDGIFSSFTTMVLPDRIIFYYNKLDRKSSGIIEVTVLANGKMIERSLSSSAEDETMIVPVESRQVAKDQMLMVTQENKNYSIWKMRF